MHGVPEKVVLHPLVLLSVVDHYGRAAKDTKKRVVGVLLGEHSKGVVDVTNSFAGKRDPAAPMLGRIVVMNGRLDLTPTRCFGAQFRSRRTTMTARSGSSITRISR